MVGGAWAWCGMAVAVGAATGHPAWGALLVAAPVAVSAVGSVRITAAVALVAAGGAAGLGVGVAVGPPLVRLLIVLAVATGSATTVVVAAVRAGGDAARQDAERASEQERRQRHEMEERTRLYRLSAALAWCSSVRDVADTTFEVLRSEAGAAAALLGMVEDGGDGRQSVRFLQAFGYRDDVLQRWPGVPLAVDLPTTAVIRGEEAIFASTAEDLARRWPLVAQDVRSSGFAAVCVLPLLVSARAVGFLSVSWAADRDFDEDEQRFLQAVAGQCGQALERARLSDDERQARRRLAFLGDVTRLLGSSLEPADVLTRLVDLVAGSMADGCVVLLPHGPTLRREAVAGRSRQALEVATRLGEVGAANGHAGTAGDDDASGPTGRTHATGGSEPATAGGSLVERAWRDGRPTSGEVPVAAGGPAGGSPRATATVLAVPLTAAGERLGVMAFVSGVGHPAFGPDDMALAAEVAARAGTALLNATRFDRERHIADLMQRAVLPEGLPTMEGVVLDAVYRAGTAGTQVGGDWFDAVPLDDGRLFVSVGDVMGKGASAAALMSQVRTAVRAYGVVDPRPGVVLAQVEQLVATLGDARLVTAVVGVVEPATGRVVLASAGHPPAVVVGPDRCEVVEGGRHRILGVSGDLRDAQLPAEADQVPPFGDRRRGGPRSKDWPTRRRGDGGEVTVALGPRDTLVLYSDGVVERRGETLTEGVARLCAAAAACLSGEAWGERAADALVRRLLSGDEPDDDAVVLTVATPGAPGEGAPGVAPGVSSTVLPAEAASAPAARRWLRARLAELCGPDHVSEDVTQRAQLLVAELVANAVLHARTDVAVGVRSSGGAVHVEVSDQSPVLPAHKRFGPGASTGHGLVLVDELSERWGVDGNEAGKVVWFDVGLQGGPGGFADPAAVPGAGADAAPAPGGAGGTKRVPVVLRQVPVALALESAAHYDGLERELQLPARRPAGDRRGRAAGIVASMLRDAAAAGRVVTEALTPATTRWGEAMGDGRHTVDFEVLVPAEAGPACRKVNLALDEIEQWCRQGLLLAVPARPPVAAFRRWMLGQVARQCEGQPPDPWGVGTKDTAEAGDPGR